LLSNQSGEIGHIIAALKAANSGKAGFIIIERSDDPRGAKSMRDDIAACRFGDNVHVFQTPALDKRSAVDLFGELTAEGTGVAVPVTSATKKAKDDVKKLWTGSPLREAWLKLLYDDKDQCTALYVEVEKYCKIHNIQPGQPTICVWTRKTKLAGANPQFNSSKAGTRQLIDAILRSVTIPSQVLLIGPLGQNPTTALSPANANILGEYWREAPFSLLARIEQNVLFHFLMTEWNCPLVHIGMKSGQMDMCALWGQPTVVIEDEDSPTQKRTKLWADTEGSQVQTAVFVKQLPTAKGQAIRKLDNGKTSLNDEEQKLVTAGKSEFKRGFDSDDANQIVSTAFQKLTAQRKAATVSQVLYDQQEIEDFQNKVLYYQVISSAKDAHY
jgi:hypothetical protein